MCATCSAAHDLLHDVGLHVAVEQRFLLLLGERVGFVVAYVARQQDLGRRNQLRPVFVRDAEAERSAAVIRARGRRATATSIACSRASVSIWSVTSRFFGSVAIARARCRRAPQLREPSGEVSAKPTDRCLEGSVAWPRR